MVGLAPGSALFTYIGMSVKSIKSVLDGSESLGTLPIVLSIVGFLFFTGMFIYVGYLAKKSIKARSHSDSEDSLCSDEDPSWPLIKKLSAKFFQRNGRIGHWACLRELALKYKKKHINIIIF